MRPMYWRKAFKRVVRIADYTDPDAHPERQSKVFAAIDWDGQRLSITGVEGPKANGDAIGSCGQIRLDVSWHTNRIPEYSQIAGIWKRWHLNNMRAGCEHQRAERWDKRLLSEPCPTCGYKFGSEWLHEEVPDHVLIFLRQLTDASAIVPMVWLR